MATDAGGPGTPIIVTVNGCSPPTVTVMVFGPAIFPSVQVPTGVGDPESVVVGAPTSVPPPLVTVTVTATPTMRFPSASRTENVGVVGRVRPAVPVGITLDTATDLGTFGSVLLHP